MLVRSDPFRQFDRLAEQVFGTVSRPAAMPMDAWRDGNTFVVEFDLPGINPNSIDLDVERNVLTVRAERQAATGHSWRRTRHRWDHRCLQRRRRAPAHHPGCGTGQAPQDQRVH
jgi:HSP20 family molecular chaperone IbpA